MSCEELRTGSSGAEARSLPSLRTHIVSTAPQVMLRATLLLLVFSGVDADPSLVTIPGLGEAQGVLNGLAREFRGLPYAAPAVRLSNPSPPVPWTGIRDATIDGPGCPQNCTEPAGVCPPTISEDCLLLNVFTPLSATPTSNLPVLVFFHGGAFRDGFSGGELYNGTFLAAGTADPAIVVPVSYRLGAFGFLYGTGGEVPTGDDPTGNYGILDQRAALVWVKAHIGAFGGDPTRVTIWGQSAGAMSVATHLISPGSRGLFTGAVLDSEPFSLPFRSPPSAAALATALVLAAGCDAPSLRHQHRLLTPAACLRGLSLEAFLTAQTAAARNLTADLPFSLLQAFVPFTPTTGTPDVPNAPLASFQGVPGSAPVADVPIAITTVASEGTIFIREGFANALPPLEYDILLEAAFGVEAGVRIGQQYPPPPGATDLRPTTENVTTAALFRCASRNATRSLAAAAAAGGGGGGGGASGRKSPIYLGEWTRLISWAPALWTNATPAYVACWTKVCHAQELPFLFFPQLPGRTAWAGEEATLSAAGRAYLASFAARGSMGDGSGNGAPGVPWIPLDGSVDATPRLILDTGAGRRLEYEDDACALWDQLGYIFY